MFWLLSVLHLHCYTLFSKLTVVPRSAMCSSSTCAFVGSKIVKAKTSQEVALSKAKVEFICIAHFMYKTIQSALHKIKIKSSVVAVCTTYISLYINSISWRFLGHQMSYLIMLTWWYLFKTCFFRAHSLWKRTKIKVKRFDGLLCHMHSYHVLGDAAQTPVISVKIL